MFRSIVFQKPRRARMYTVDGQKYPSVTEILNCIRKPFLEQWRGRLGNLECDRISREAAEMGTRVHRVCEAINSGGTDAAIGELEPFHRSYTSWFVANVERVVGAEKLLVSRGHRYAGTADLIAVLKDGSTAIVDLKTGGIVAAEFGLQLEAYRRALLEQDGIEATRRIVIQMPRKEPGALLVHEYDDHQADWRAFLAASVIWWRLFSESAAAGGRA